jgi:GMP synthase (glutamine-hydrolysing)
MKQDMIVILDLGSHENTVLARAIRALGVYSEIYPHDITAAELKAYVLNIFRRLGVNFGSLVFGNLSDDIYSGSYSYGKSNPSKKW